LVKPKSKVYLLTTSFKNSKYPFKTLSFSNIGVVTPTKKTMKHSLLTLITILSVSNLFAQTNNGINIYYGANYFMPSRGYAHSFGIEKELFDCKYGNINGEISFLIGGPYGFNLYSSNGEAENLDNPYKVFHATLGSNFEMPLKSTKNKISIGVSGGYSRYWISRATLTPIVNGGIVQGYFDLQNKLILASSLRYKQHFKIGKLQADLVPNYNIYRTSIFTHSAGVLLAIEF